MNFQFWKYTVVTLHRGILSRPAVNLFALFVLIQLSMTGQDHPSVNGRVIDRESREPLAFVAIAVSNTGQGAYSDIDGYFHLKLVTPGTVLSFYYLGYTPTNFEWKGEDYLEIALDRSARTLGEVEIRPGINPAERIIRSAIDNKRRNDPESDLTFRYDSYNKLVFTAEVDSALRSDPSKINSLDTSERQAIKLLDEQYLFLMESATERKFMPPNRSEETIIATRVSGLQNPEFALLGTQLQSFSFYEETVDILDHTYLSPIAGNALSKYLFILEDTTFSGTDTVFTISYRPRKGKNFDGLSGQLFINTNGFALQQVIAAPAEKNESGFDIKIQQRYEFIDGRKWFPVQLNSRIDMPFAKVNSFGLVGIGRSYIRDIRLGETMRAGEFTPITLQMEPLAARQPDSLWNKYREHALDEKELKTYHVIDSIGKAEDFDTKMALFQMMASGKIPMGRISLDLDRLFRFNQHEGFRLGLGLHTNDFLSRRFAVGGYVAYGFKDKEIKYGGDVLLHLYRKRNAWLRLLYSNDVMETGGNQLDKALNALDPAKYYQLYIRRMDQREKTEFQLNGRLIGNLTVTVFANHQTVVPFENYSFVLDRREGVELNLRTFAVSEAGAVLRWAPGEKIARTGSREIRLGGRWPVTYFSVAQGLDETFRSDFQYQRFDVMLEKKFRMRTSGELDVRVFGGSVDPHLPLPLLYNAKGSFGIGPATPFAFETMRTNEFQHARFGAIHLRHNFKDLLFKGKKAGPYVVLVHSMLWGEALNAGDHSVEVRSAEKGYYESGIELDRLLKLQFSGLGIGVFYRYGPYHLERRIDNFAFKLSYVFMF